MKNIIVNKNDANQRLDKFITKAIPKLPKSLLYKGLRKNNVRLNGKHCHDGSIMLHENDVIALYYPDEFFEKNKEKITNLPEPEIIYEDENIIIANKPKGLLSHCDQNGVQDTMIGRIISYLINKHEYIPESENTFSPALCNRLDRNTSGLIIAAKNAESLRIINEKIRNREVEKYYICKCIGKPDTESGIIKSHLIRDEKIVKINDNSDGKQIVTEYKVLSSDTDTSLIEIKLITGRTHQIRAHMAHIGHPLKGDVKYGGSRSKNGYYLNCYKLVFEFKTNAGIMNYLHGKTFTI